MRVPLSAALATILAAGVTHAAGPVRPTIHLESASGDQYGPGADMNVRGRVTVLTKTDIRVWTYHVLPDGGLIPHGGAEVPLNADGTFHVNLHPASPGWRPGTLRIVARIGAMRHIKTSYDVTIAEPNEPQKDSIIREPVSSGLTIDLDKHPTAAEVITGQTFLIRGSTKLESQRPVILKLVRTDHPRGEVIYDSEIVRYLLSGDDRRWFEIEMKAPGEEGNYELRAIIPGGGGREEKGIPVRLRKPEG